MSLDSAKQEQVIITWFMFLYANGNVSVTVDDPSVMTEVQSVVPRVIEMTAVLWSATF